VIRFKRVPIRYPTWCETLASVLPQFTGDDLEAQLQTFDTFLGILSPSVRPEIVALLREAAAKVDFLPPRARIVAAADSIEQGGRACEPYDHAKAMDIYQQRFQQAFPDRPVPKGAKRNPGSSVPPELLGTHPDILAQLDKIETEIKKIGRWSANPPTDFAAKVRRGEIESYLDAPTFELWLQLLLLPRARQAALDDKLPQSSQVGEMARRQYDYMSVDYDAATLLKLLGEFDDLVMQSHNRMG
jgi:uncharacterized protein YqcC (DUF446 family)